MKVTLWQTISQNQATQSQIERRNQGYKRMLASSLVSLAVLVLASPAARATTMDQFTLMSGTDTVVFTLPSSPTPTGTDFDCQAQLPPQFCISGVSALVNGIAETGDTLEFFDLSQEGGLAFSNGGPFPLFDSLGEQLYSGPVTAPTFLLGMFDQISFPDGGAVTVTITEVTPEPSSLVLLGSGLVAVAGMLRKQLVG
jgi:hypothetical protein